MISAEHITKSFDDFTVLSDVSLTVKKGEIYGLIGYNGVGKTTLLKIMCGIYRPDSGRALINGQPVYENPAVKQQCFFMTEEASFFLQSSLNRMRKFYSGYYPDWSDDTFNGLVEWFGVDPSMKISRFSKGMQRQASLILAFSTRPEYLFLDEAFDGLDYSMRIQVRDMFRFYVKNRGATILVTSHNLKELEDLADHIGMLHEGRLTFDDSTGQMRKSYQACEFTYAGDIESIGISEIELIEKTDILDEKTDSARYYCIIHASEKDARRKLQAAGAEDIQSRPVQLEEFFRMERKERDVDWEKIFR